MEGWGCFVGFVAFIHDLLRCFTNDKEDYSDDVSFWNKLKSLSQGLADPENPFNLHISINTRKA